jgi:uncharacterized damage-inducible protein DinB
MPRRSLLELLELIAMQPLLPEFEREFRRHKNAADRAMASLDDADFFRRPGTHVNPIALIVKHLAGNLASRWTDFLTGDGDKPGRDRDAEFVISELDTRATLCEAWENGWRAVFETIGTLHETDLDRTVTIRGEGHTVVQALLRATTHAAYHVGQILYVARMLRPDAPWLTIAPGSSASHGTGRYLAKPRNEGT